METLVVNLTGLPGAAAGHRPADITLVGHAAAEADELVADVDRRQHDHVGCVWAATKVRVVDQVGVARLKLALCVELEKALHRSWEGAEVKRQDGVLSDDAAVAIHQGAACVA